MSIKPNEIFFQHHLSGQGPKGEDLYNFQCQHGPAECQGNMVHACATEVVQSPSLVLKYIKCMIGDNYSPLEAGERCANSVGIAWEKIERCVTGTEGHGLLAGFGDMTHKLQPRVSFIPTIQGQIYPSFRNILSIREVESISQSQSYPCYDAV